jgi:hypothetical protein
MRTTLLLLALALLPAMGADRFLVRDGQPMARIVTTDQPPRMTKLAAEELRDYLLKISGAELPIATAPADLCLA